MSSLTLYGSNVANGTLSTACTMSATTGGVEASVTTTTTSGPPVYAEVLSQVATISGGPAITSPTGNGWVYATGAGTFSTGNWSGSVTLSSSSNAQGLTLRFFRYSGGCYTSIGTIAVSSGFQTAKKTYSFAATSMSSITFGTPDLLYVDLWWFDNASAVSGDNPVVYVSNSASQGVASDMQITTSSFAGGGSLTLYGSNVANGTLTTACTMSNTTGGSETSVTTTTTGGATYAEVLSQTGTSMGVSSIPPHAGNGWVYSPGAGTFLSGNWSASVTLSSSSNAQGMTIRFSRYAGGCYTTIGTIVVSSGFQTAKKTYSFTNTSMSPITLAASHLLYVDFFWFDNASSVSGDNPVIYLSNSASQGVANDMQVTTSNFVTSLRVMDGMGGVFR